MIFQISDVHQSNFSIKSWIIAREVEKAHLGFQKNLKILMILIRERWKENLMKIGVSAEKRRKENEGCRDF